MHTTHLRKVGGSIMLAIPPSLLDMLHLHAGEAIGIAIEGNRLVLEAREKPLYTLHELLAECDPSKPLPRKDRDWLDSGPTGGELL